MTRNSILGYYPYTLFRTLPSKKHLSLAAISLFFRLSSPYIFLIFIVYLRCNSIKR